MTRWHSPKEQLDAARSPAATNEDLRLLARSPYGFVRVAVAENPKTEDRELEAMLPRDLDNHRDQELADAIARNPRASERTLRTLATLLEGRLANRRTDHLAFRAGVQLCCHANAPLDVIREILRPDHCSAEFRKVVARETGRSDVLHLLSEDASERVQRALRRRRGD